MSYPVGAGDAVYVTLPPSIRSFPPASVTQHLDRHLHQVTSCHPFTSTPYVTIPDGQGGTVAILFSDARLATASTCQQMPGTVHGYGTIPSPLAVGDLVTTGRMSNGLWCPLLGWMPFTVEDPHAPVPPGTLTAQQAIPSWARLRNEVGIEITEPWECILHHQLVQAPLLSSLTWASAPASVPGSVTLLGGSASGSGGGFTLIAPPGFHPQPPSPPLAIQDRVEEVGDPSRFVGFCSPCGGLRTHRIGCPVARRSP